MKKILWLIPALGALSCASVGADDKLMKPYPAPAAGYQRFVVELAPQTSEDRFKIEILAGKTLPVDCNRVVLGVHYEIDSIVGQLLGETLGRYMAGLCTGAVVLGCAS